MTNNQYREFSRQIKALAVMCGLATTMSVGHAQQPGALAPVVGATVAGVPLTQYARPDDSTSGVTQATPANRAMTCSAGYVLSGGSCVTLASMIPPTPNCAYGQTWSGGACVSISGFSPPPINCPAGQVLSGSVCVALPVAAAPTCAAQPDTTQYVPCSAGQTGVITQTRSGSCNISTGYVWAMSSWNTQSSTCVSAPPAPVVVAPPPPPPATCSVLPTLAWGAGCSGPASPSGTLASGATTSATSNVANWPGSTTYACSNGALTQTAGTCSFNQPPAPPMVYPLATSWEQASHFKDRGHAGEYECIHRRTSNGNFVVSRGINCSADRGIFFEVSGTATEINSSDYMNPSVYIYKRIGDTNQFRMFSTITGTYTGTTSKAGSTIFLAYPM